jgi:hypothetical protein
MAVTTPDWLSKHEGELRAGTGGRTWLVVLNGEPQYRLVPFPASGKYSCHVTQTVNGKRLDKGGIFPSVDEAVQGGLEDLRQALGW